MKAILNSVKLYTSLTSFSHMIERHKEREKKEVGGRKGGDLSVMSTLNFLEHFSEECSILRSVPVQRYEGEEMSDT